MSVSKWWDGDATLKQHPSSFAISESRIAAEIWKTFDWIVYIYNYIIYILYILYIYILYLTIYIYYIIYILNVVGMMPTSGCSFTAFIYLGTANSGSWDIICWPAPCTVSPGSWKHRFFLSPFIWFQSQKTPAEEDSTMTEPKSLVKTCENHILMHYMGVSENSVALFTQWFCWSLSLLNGYNWEYTQHFQTNPYRPRSLGIQSCQFLSVWPYVFSMFKSLQLYVPGFLSGWPVTIQLGRKCGIFGFNPYWDILGLRSWNLRSPIFV